MADPTWRGYNVDARRLQAAGPFLSLVPLFIFSLRLLICASMSNDDISSNIPIVSMQDLASQQIAERDRAAGGLREAFGRFGLVYIGDHGIGRPILDAYLESFGAFTQRPVADKQALARPDLWYQRGWTPPNTEKAVVAGGQPDFKECYFAAPEPLDEEARSQYPQVYADNIWPDDGGRLERGLLDMGHALHDVGRRLLRGCAHALGLKPYQFEQVLHGGPHVTRALRYLPLTSEQAGTEIVWGEEHTDFNLLTLLPGGRFYDPSGEPCAGPDETGGLYLRTRASAAHPQGQLVRGRAPEGCIIAQVGQQLEILTGGIFQATPHVIRAPLQPGYTRVSAAHFIHMHAHRVVYPLERFRTHETIAAYSPPVLAGTYGLKTLVDIGLAPIEALGRLGYRHYDRLVDARS
ncbi:MAG: isopenicillin N synthase-like dioxygenase [Myxococcota bacterium]|jgi:isopenicillin N synthase-like dioxygenase